MAKDSGNRIQGTGYRAVGWALPTNSTRRFELVGGAHPTRGITLVEMLVAMAITLVMMAAVVTLFANVTGSVRNRRATIEMSGQLRHVRNMLQADLANATCFGLTWQRPESNRGYIEIIEGPHRDSNPSTLIGANPSPSSPRDWPPTAENPEIDHTTSIIPSSNLPLDDPKWGTDGAGLGDYDDVLMLTARNEHEPFVGRVPDGVRPNEDDAEGFRQWNYTTIKCPLAEVVWFAVENPGFTDNTFDSLTATADGFFGEPGMRTIYRRALLVAPWINPYRYVDPTTGVVTDTFTEPGSGGDTFQAEPGLVRILPQNTTLSRAVAALIAFQDRYDLSVRLEFDPLLDAGDGGRWKIVANTLGDLTKRENRFAHAGYRPGATMREFPFPALSAGSGYSGSTANVVFVVDPEYAGPGEIAQAEAHLVDAPPQNGIVASYTVEPENFVDPNLRQYAVRPFAYVDPASDTVATARAMLNDDGEVVRVVHGLVPLWGTRRGEDVMLTDALALDLRVFDPGAPLFGVRDDPTDSSSPVTTVLEPGDVAWWKAYENPANMNSVNTSTGTGPIGTSTTVYPFVGQGAYVDLGYGYIPNRTPPELPPPVYASTFSSAVGPWFFTARALSDVYGNQLAPGYAVYDTWSLHYENNGVNEDQDFNAAGLPMIDEGTNGLDDVGVYWTSPSTFDQEARLGPDDVGERETAPPYDRPLRGVQVTLRLYERDSRQIRQATVRQQFMPQ